MSSQGTNSKNDRRSAGSRTPSNRELASPGIPSSSPLKFQNPNSPMSQLSTISRASKVTTNGKHHQTNSQADFSDMFRSSPLHYGSETGGFNLKSSSQYSQLGAFRNRVDIQKESGLVKEVYMPNENQENVANNVASSEMNGHSQVSTATSSNQHLVIWGTDVSIGQCKERFKTFLNYSNFNPDNLGNEELEMIKEAGSEGDAARITKPLYMQKLEEIYTLEDPFLNLNCHHLYEFDADLYRKLVNYPQEVIPIFDMAVNEGESLDFVV